MKISTMKKVKFLLLCLLIAFSMTACGGGGSDGSSTSGQVGTVGVSLTDNSGLYNAVVLSIEKIGIVASNSDTTYYNSADFSELPVTVDILDLPGEATLFLGDIDVPLPGDGSEVCFNQIRLVLSEEGNYVIENGDPEMTKHDLKTPSGQTSGVKILVKEEAFCISNEDDSVNVAIEFDPSTAIIFKENSTNPYQFKPTSMRIIKGNFFTAPESFIDGLVSLPTYNTSTGCEEFETKPAVTVTATYYNTAELASKTVALTEGPFKEDGLCSYSGAFKLLLPDKEIYDLSANWDTFNAEMLKVEYNSTVVLELTE